MSAPDAANRAAAARDAARDAHRAMRAAPPDAASRVADALRAKEPLLDMKQRTTHDDPEGFMPTFFAASRLHYICLLYTSPSPRDQRGSRMPSSA